MIVNRRLTPPYIVGYEFAGQVAEVGTEVVDLNHGDRVWGLLPVRGTRWGSYSTEVVANAGYVTRRPQSLSGVEAAAVPLTGATALQLLDRLDPGPGEWMVVHGAAGGVGHLLVQLAHARGVRVAAAASPERHEFLRQLGVEIVVDRHQANPIEVLRDAIGCDVPVVADLVGGDRVRASLPIMTNGGRAGSIVALAGDFAEAVDRNITLHGVLVRPGTEVLNRLAELVSRSALRPVVDAVYNLADAALAHQRVESGHGQGKVVLSVSTNAEHPDAANH